MRRFAVVLLLSLSSCESATDPAVVADSLPEEPTPTPSPIANAEFGGLRQSVSVHGDVASGALWFLASRLENISAVPISVEAWDRGLEIEGVGLGPSELIGAFVTLSVDLGPGEFLDGGDIRRVESTGGTYRVRVQHSQSPWGAVTFDLDVGSDRLPN